MTENFKIEIKNPYSSGTQPGSVQTTTTSSEALPIVNEDNKTPKTDAFVSDYEAKLELFLKQKGITLEQCTAEIVGFETLSPEEKYQAVTVKFAAFEAPTEKAELSAKKEETPVKDSSNTEEFDHVKFSKLDEQGKIDVIFEELTKNKFLYGNKENQKTTEDWNKLTDEQKQGLISEFKQNIEGLIKEKSNGKLESLAQLKALIGDAFNEKSVDKSLNEAMNYIQTANANEMSAKEFLKLGIDENGKVNEKGILARETMVHEYISDLADISKEENLSEYQKEYINENRLISDAIIYHAKTNGDNRFKDGTFRLNPQEIKDYFDEINEGKPDSQKLSDLDLELAYLKHQKERGAKISDYENNEYELLSKTQDGLDIVQKLQKKDYGRMEAFKKSQYSQDWDKPFTTSKGKVRALVAYTEKNFSNLKPEEYAKAVRELTSELQSNPETEAISFKVYAEIMKKSTSEQQIALASAKDVRAQASNSFAVNDMNLDAATISAQTQDEIARTSNDSVWENVMLSRINNSDDVHAHATSKIDAAAKFETVQKAHAEKAYQIKNDDMQAEMLMNVKELSCDDVAIYAGKRLDEVKNKENQINLYTAFVERKAVNNAMIEDGTFNRLHKDNITTAYKAHIERCQQNDYTHEESVKQLTVLSDKIQDCKYADKQLEMHNEIMNLDSSRYSEVLEHAAGNIKNYDPSVQIQALDTVYQKAQETGNQRLIDNALVSVSNSKDLNVQAQEIVRYIGETALKEALEKELHAKFLSGNLSAQELKQFSTAERRQYILNYFKKLPIDQKIKLLSSIKNNSMRKIVYTMVARTDSHLFNEICKDKDRANQLLSMGLPEDVNKKVSDVVRFLAVADIGFQNVAKQHDIEYDGMKENPKTAHSYDYASIPEEFKGLPKETYALKKGNFFIV